MTELPNDWKCSTIGEVAEIVRGVTYSKGDTLSATDIDAVPLLRATNLEVDSIDFNDMVYVPKRVVKPQQVLQVNDVFMAASSGSISVVGKSAQVVKTNGETFGAFCSVIRPKNVHPKFLAYWVQSPEIRDHWSATAKGTNINNLKPSDISGTYIPIPPMKDQQKIVELLEDHLSRLDAALAEVKQAKVKAAQFRRSLFQAAFTGNLIGDGTRGGTDLPNGWEIKPLEALCDTGKQAIVDGPFGSNLKRSDYVESGIPVLKIQNIKENVITLKKMDFVKPEKYKELVRHSFTDGDIVMTKLGDPLGVSAIVNGISNGLIVADLVRIRASKVNTKFLCYQLNSPRIQKYINELQKGTTRPRVNLAMIRNLPIYIPSIDQQHKIVEILEDHLSRLDASVAIADAMEKQSSSLRRSLLQAAFSGQLTKEVASV